MNAIASKLRKAEPAPAALMSEQVREKLAELRAKAGQVADCADPQKGHQAEFIADKGRDGWPFARRIVILK
jgi:hypothetical protein